MKYILILLIIILSQCSMPTAPAYFYGGSYLQVEDGDSAIWTFTKPTGPRDNKRGRVYGAIRRRIRNNGSGTVDKFMPIVHIRATYNLEADTCIEWLLYTWVIFPNQVIVDVDDWECTDCTPTITRFRIRYWEVDSIYLEDRYGEDFEGGTYDGLPLTNNTHPWYGHPATLSKAPRLCPTEKNIHHIQGNCPPLGYIKRNLWSL